MNKHGQRQPQTKFFGEDIVERIDDPSSSTGYGVVMRCWHDSDDLLIQGPPVDHLLRPLKRGEIGVSFFPSNSREILPESSFKLIDRPMQVGDICKRNYEDVQSAVVTRAEVKFKVSHAVSGAKLDDWKVMDDVKEFDDIAIGDLVVYDDWVGQIREFFDDSIIQTSNGHLVRLPELSARLVVGERGPDILPNPPDEGLQGLLSYFIGDLRPSTDDLVVSVKHTVFAVAWIAINQMLTPEDAAKRQRPKKFWVGPEISKLTLLRGINDLLPRVGDRLTLKTVPEGMITTHGQSEANGGVVSVETFVVCETQTLVDLLWQDGSTETVRSTELIPYLNPDEYDCWPGEHVVWKTEDEKQAAVVQSVNAAERMAKILLPDGRCEKVSVLELDPHGTDPDVTNPLEGFGVHRGDLVFIHAEGRTNGCAKPIVPSIGELGAWAHEVPFVEAMHGELSGWRKELDDIGHELARQSESPIDYKIGKPVSGDGRINWFGKVTDLHLDGSVEVTLPDFSKINVPIERLSRLDDGLEEIEDLWGDDLSESHSAYAYENGDEETLEIQTEDGHWQQYSGEPEDEWIDEDDEEEAMSIVGLETEPNEIEEILEDVTVAGSNDVVPGAWPARDITDDHDTPRPPSTPIPIVADIAPQSVSTNAMEVEAMDPHQSTSQPSWKRFDILSSAPRDHAFLDTTAAEPSRQFLARLQKEYRALSSSLPESVIVRTYEDRSDLLRSLIIGPENTPYEDAPFVIDWKLDSNFPHSPPIAHFHSWTNGNGRVNPNLYEEGKVCLSILGTWAGDRSESWNPARSSLLQALVSIQGLVLVKEPWFCEPAYEKLRGTDEGKVNSRLYNEKAYVLSRGFVRRALEIPVGSLEDVIQDIFITRGRLAKVIKSARRLVEKSRTAKGSEDENDVDMDDLAVPRLTEGGIIPLTRTLDKLEVILAASSKGASA